MSKSSNNPKGRVMATYAGARFLVQMDDGKEIKAYLAGKMKLRKIQVSVGDMVEVVLDPLGGNATNRIVYRL